MYNPLNSGSRCVALEHQKAMPEAKDIRWNDDFFYDQDGTIAVFDFDYEQMEDYNFKVQAINLIAPTIFFGAYGFILFQWYGVLGVSVSFLFLVPFVKLQVHWQVQSNHLAITRDGIRSVQDKRKSCLGWSMCDKGKRSKTVPFDKITDCDVVEPAGNTCCIIPQVLFIVNVDTASSGGEGKRHELRIPGLHEPHKFKALVWAMKRQRDAGLGANYKAPPPVHLEMTERNQQSMLNKGEGGEVTTLLKDIRDELRENNELLRKIHEDGPNKTHGATEAEVATISEH